MKKPGRPIVPFAHTMLGSRADVLHGEESRIITEGSGDTDGGNAVVGAAEGHLVEAHVHMEDQECLD